MSQTASASQESRAESSIQHRKHQLASQSHGILEKLQHEAEETGSHAWAAFSSFSWLWPIRGVVYSITHPQIILSVRHVLLKSLVTSIVLFVVLAFFTFVPQMAILAVFTGPLSPIFALVLVGAESVILISLFARALFLEPALTRVFDATLASQGQTQLVQAAKTRDASSTARNVGSQLVKPLQALSSDGLIRYALSLPLNFIPVAGTVLFLLYNGHKAGPGWHSRYFDLKGLSKSERAAFVESRRAAYTAFGMMTLLLNFVPLVGLLFSFTNTVGAALWAAELEAKANIIDGEIGSRGEKKLQ
ncbi:hypothetical protein BD311DRAFT_711145 [Dichomitus squalens]|uniref:Etoposide-induced protein 2.4-domain-containing protein n=1 Tax=Dichomitus squalens TaxID=114155 RepID=A0A4Q9N117_9APHY|nr:hypothetical protein BD311DRAFT_711145 [Dichomitus squalens]